MGNAKSPSSNMALEILSQMFTVEMGFMNSSNKDIDVLSTAFHPDVVVHIPASLPYAGDWRGLDALGRLFTVMHDTWSAINVEDMEATIDGDTLFMGGTLVATTRRSNKEIRQPFAQMLKIKNGLVVEGFPFYSDTAEIVAALDPEPAGVVR